MGVTTTNNKPFNPRGNDQSPKGYNRAKLYSGKALDFDGVNDIVNTTYTSGFTGAQEFTYCAYINTDTNQNSQAIIHADENAGWGLQSLQIRTETNGIRFLAGTGSALTSYVDSEVVEANKWYFVVGTHTPTENKIYINGVLNATATADNLTTAPDAIIVGAYPALANPYNGQITNAKVFNTALTAAQVADLYNNPEKVVPTGVDNTALKLWLPMMEGAGTTAYDGSGNGNHGTIAGATYVNGIGAPVAQSAVIDWNKGTNIISRSENAEHVNWGKYFLTATDGETDPLGTNRAFEITENTGLQSRNLRSSDFSAVSGTQYYFSVIAKQGIGSRYLGFAGAGIAGASESPVFDLQNGSVDVGATNAIVKSASIEAYGSDGWYKCSMVYEANATTTYQIWLTMCQNATDNGTGNYSYVGNGTSSIFLFAPMFKVGSAEGVYVQTIATTQPTPVLLPQGLTTGRDITGVNLFENVRKQGALNLDGKSWAEVHDNASLDIGEITLECWINSTDKDQYHHILSKNKSGNTSYAILTEITTGYLGFEAVSGEFKKTDYNVMDGNWNHIVVTYDETNLKFYINGALDETIAYTSTIPNNDVDLHIGARPDGVQLFESDIAQPRIYNRALTSAEVLRNYNSGKNTYTND
jgi:hypothetical protein